MQNFSPVSIYLFKVDDGNTKTMYEICPKLTIKTSKQHHPTTPEHGFLTFSGSTERRHSCVFIVNFGQISYIVLVFPLLTLNKQVLTGNLESKRNSHRKTSITRTAKSLTEVTNHVYLPVLQLSYRIRFLYKTGFIEQD